MFSERVYGNLGENIINRSYKGGIFLFYKFSCNNFRNIHVTDLEFARINLLVGPNNSGKSNFIRALSFCVNMVGNDSNGTPGGFLAEVKRNGWKEILNKDATNPEIDLSWEIGLPDKKVKYDFSFLVGNNTEEYRILNESLDSADKLLGYKKPFNYFRCHDRNPGMGMFSVAIKKGEINKRIHVPVEKNESVFLQFEKLLINNPGLYTEYVRKNIFQILQEMRVFFERFHSYSCSAFNLDEIRQLRSPEEITKRLSKNGANFTNVFRYFCDSDAEFYVRYLNRLKMLMPELENISIRRGLDKIGIALTLSGKEYMLSEVSDGTVKALLLTLLLSLPKDSGPSMLAIDEPEVNLHLAWQKLLAKWILTSGNFEQCFISTHSPDFLDEFTKGFLSGDVNVFTYTPLAEQKIRKVEVQELKEILAQGWLLGDLYRTNDPSIGGWPW